MTVTKEAENKGSDVEILKERSRKKAEDYDFLR